jgi:hypothetical protein
VGDGEKDFQGGQIHRRHYKPVLFVGNYYHFDF